MGESLTHQKQISTPSTRSKNSALPSAYFFLALLVKPEDGGDKFRLHLQGRRIRLCLLLISFLPCSSNLKMEAISFDSIYKVEELGFAFCLFLSCLARQT
jgi:hypothetical protein